MIYVRIDHLCLIVQSDITIKYLRIKEQHTFYIIDASQFIVGYRGYIEVFKRLQNHDEKTFLIFVKSFLFKEKK